MAKLLGWILILLGIALIVLKLLALKLLAFKSVIEKISFLANLSVLWTVIAGLVLIALGFLIKGKRGAGKHAAEEVPIYRGREIVGYRRR